ADHDELLWRFSEFERFGAADNCFVVEFREWQFHRRAPGGDDNVLRFDLLRVAIGGFNRNFSGRGDRAYAFEHRDLVGLHQRSHATVEGLNDFVLPFLHFREIDSRVVDDDAVLRGLFFNKDEMIARSKKRLTRDATDVQACATEFFVLFDYGSFQAELPGPDRSNVATGSGANDNNVKFFHNSFRQKSSGSLLGSSMHSFTLMRKVTASFPSMAR